MAFSKEQAAALKRHYFKDARVMLRHVPQAPDMPKVLCGTVTSVDEDGVHVSMDDGRTRILVPGEDDFRRLSFEETAAEWLKIKFYSPLKVQCFEVYDSEYLSDQRTSGRRELSDSVKCINDINDAIKRNVDDYTVQEELFISGIGEYDIGSNIMALNLSVEEHNNELWGVSELQYKHPFRQDQLEILKEYIMEEYKSGWGKQFGFINITPKNNGHYRLNAHFFQDTDDYKIMTDSEFESYQVLYSTPPTRSEESAEEEKEPVLRINIIKNGRHLAELPVSEYDLIQALYEAKCDTPDAGYTLELDSYHEHWGEYENLDLTGTNLQELNCLAAKISGFDDYEQRCFDAYMKTQDSVTVRRLINAAYNINDIIWHPFGNDKELGEFALDNEMIAEYESLPDSVYEALDREKAGVKFREIDGGAFVNGGYLHTNEFDEIYDGITLPDSKPLSAFQVRLCHGYEGDSVWIDLPASETALAFIKEKYHDTQYFQYQQTNDLSR